MTDHQLTLLVFLPMAGALLLPLVPARRAGLVTLMVCLAELACSWWLFAGRGGAVGGGFFLLEDRPWIGRFGIRYILGMDAISGLLVLLTSFMTLLASLSSWNAVTGKRRLHYTLLLVMESGIVGVFLALDLFLFYLFWELMLIPMFLLIGIWGHGRRIYSALKFFLFTMGGSLLMLLAIIGLHLVHAAQTGAKTFSLTELCSTQLASSTSVLLFAAFLLSFAVKVPLVPLHTWLPDAHTDAPTAGSIILAALLLKTGGYGLIRFAWPLFPEGARALTPLLYVLSVGGILYASWIAFAQRDMKRLVAYSSIGHMGFVVLGIAAWTPVALSGAILQMVNHGITTGALFALVGMLDERTGTREIDAFGGLWGSMPRFSFFFLLFAMASAGLPGLANFTGEFLILAGAFKPAPVAATIAFAGIVLPLVYTVRLVQETLFTLPRTPRALSDLSVREGALLLVLGVMTVWLGVHPAPVLDLLHDPVAALAGEVAP